MKLDLRSAAARQAADDPGTDGLARAVMLRRWIQSDEQTWSSPSVTLASRNAMVSNSAARIWVILNGVIQRKAQMIYYFKHTVISKCFQIKMWNEFCFFSYGDAKNALKIFFLEDIIILI